MKNYGLKMTLGQETLEETEEGSLFERIYSRARVKEDMRSKVNEKVKTFLEKLLQVLNFLLIKHLQV